MKKVLILSIGLVLIFSTAAFAGSYDKQVKLAINKYKVGNYTGCLQTMQDVLRKEPSNAVAQYYVAMSYVQAGKSEEAMKAYDRVLTMKPNSLIYQYAQQGKACLSGGAECATKETEDEQGLDVFLKSPVGNGLSSEVNAEIRKQKLKALQDVINKDTEVSPKTQQEILDFDKKKSINSQNPTNDEIAQALKTLQRAGITLNAGMPNPYMQAGMNPQVAQMSMMMGQNTSSNNGNNMLNMLPYMLAQNNNSDGTQNTISPQVLQAMMMSSMMPDFTFDTHDKDR